MLPDPRRYGSRSPDLPLLALADGSHQQALVGALRDLAAAGRDAEIRSALAAAPARESYARVRRALCDALEKPAAEDDLSPRVFAIPWVIVCGGSAPSVVSCVLPDVPPIARVLEEHGVFGGSRNVGFSNVLCGIDALEALAPSDVLRGWNDPRVRDMPPSPIAVARGVEEVHVRFLLGAAIAPAHAPGIAETGSNVGAWGTAALRVMASLLATANVQILPMPRPPGGLYSAAYAGRRAGLEAAFNLFMSNSVRRFRSSVGDPSVTLSAHESGDIRVTLWTPFDDAIVEGFSWPLHPAEDLAEIEHAITGLIEECRLPEPTVHSDVLPDRTRTGAIFFPTR
jgi:hypothetical protein